MHTHHFKRAMRQDIQLLWDEIERKSQSTICVDFIKKNECPLDTRMGCDASAYPFLKLLKIDGEPVYDGAALHELLHLQRYVVDGVPALDGLGAWNGSIAGYIENALEHLTIVPMQASWNLSEIDRWNGFIDNGWQGFARGDHTPFTRIQWAKLTWMSSHLCSDENLILNWQEIVEGLDEKDAILNFKKEVVARINDKQAQATYVISDFGLDKTKFALRNHKTKVVRNLDGKLLNMYGDVIGP